MNKPSEIFTMLTDTLCSGPTSEAEFIQTHLSAFTPDGHDNVYHQVGDSHVMFCCHMDTVGQDGTKIVRYTNGRFMFTDGKSQLGADDRAGVALCLYMIQNNVPGLYYFFSNEERGATGSSGMADAPPDVVKNIDIAIELDRMGYEDVIYRQGSETGSYECALQISNLLADHKVFMHPSKNGIFTDTANLTHVINECLNISVGYRHQHTHSEIQDLYFLDHLGSAMIQIDWQSLVAVKEKSKKFDRWAKWDTYSETYYKNGKKTSKYFKPAFQGLFADDDYWDTGLEKEAGYTTIEDDERIRDYVDEVFDTLQGETGGTLLAVSADDLLNFINIDGKVVDDKEELFDILESTKGGSEYVGMDNLVFSYRDYNYIALAFDSAASPKKGLAAIQKEIDDFEMVIYENGDYYIYDAEQLIKYFV